LSTALGTREFYCSKREMFLDAPNYPFEFTVVGKCLVDRWEVMANILYDLSDKDDTILSANENQEFLCNDGMDELPF